MEQRAADFVTKIFAARFTRWRSACCKLLYAISWDGMNYAESMRHSQTLASQGDSCSHE